MSDTGQPVKLSRPLDFYMITDHPGGMGAITDIPSGVPNILADEQGKQFHEAFARGGQDARMAAQELTKQFAQGTISPALNCQPGNPAYERVWDDIVAAAEEFNDPGVFTAFIAFEWTSLDAGDNLHRKVIFRDGPERAGEVLPYTTTPPRGSSDPRELWTVLQNYEDVTGGDVTAIPHNGNLSNGTMFPLVDDCADGAPLDAAYAEDAIARQSLAQVGHSGGVPMGGDLVPPAEGEAPDFLVCALRDEMGANPDRVQIVKGWIDAETGGAMQKVHDVAWGGDRVPDAEGKRPPVGNTVDLSIPSWTNDIGAPDLGAVRTDPDFDPAEPAFYDARVIEISTPRRTAYDAVKFGAEMGPDVTMITQDRAYTSPIWFTPN